MDRSIRARVALCVLAGALSITGCGAAGLTTAEPTGGRSLEPVEQFPELNYAVEEQRLAGHLDALETIAGEHGGVRTVGTPGYEASVDYVAGQLRALGFEVETPEVEITTFRETEAGRGW